MKRDGELIRFIHSIYVHNAKALLTQGTVGPASTEEHEEQVLLLSTVGNGPSAGEDEEREEHEPSPLTLRLKKLQDEREETWRQARQKRRSPCAYDKPQQALSPCARSHIPRAPRASPRSAIRLSYAPPPPMLRHQIQQHLRYLD